MNVSINKKEAIPLLIIAVLIVVMIMLASSVEHIASNTVFDEIDLSVDSPFCYKDCTFIQPPAE